MRPCRLTHFRCHIPPPQKKKKKPTELSYDAVPTRFVLLEDLIAHGRLPRFGSAEGFQHPVTGEPNANLCRPFESFDGSKTCFIFVSHRCRSPRPAPHTTPPLSR